MSDTEHDGQAPGRRDIEEELIRIDGFYEELRAARVGFAADEEMANATLTVYFEEMRDLLSQENAAKFPELSVEIEALKWATATRAKKAQSHMVNLDLLLDEIRGAREALGEGDLELGRERAQSCTARAQLIGDDLDARKGSVNEDPQRIMVQGIDRQWVDQVGARILELEDRIVLAPLMEMIRTAQDRTDEVESLNLEKMLGDAKELVRDRLESVGLAVEYIDRHLRDGEPEVAERVAETALSALRNMKYELGYLKKDD
ncbi:hypothetical protein [Salininema proteolyticum]|uniref:Uncharacterized protein n=1 Tax=Salininema proteolyticum TaxID=1607685 RepID=A0ABV8TSW2_9ACTN